MDLIANAPWLLPAVIVLLALCSIGMMALRLGRAARKLRVLSASLQERDQALSEEGDQLASLTSLMRAINEEGDPNSLLRGVLAQLQTLLRGAESVSVLMRRNEDGPFIIRASTHTAPSSSFYLSEAEAEARYQTSAECIDEQIFLICNTAGLPGNERVHKTELARSLLVFRLGDAHRLQGYVVLANHRYTNAFDAADVQRLAGLREHVGAAFEKLRLMESLRQARETTQQSLRFKAAFLANISHEIRTPMNAIIGFSRLGEDVQRLDQAHSYLRKIADAGNTLLALVNDVLDLSTIEAGRMEIDPVHFDLHGELERLNELFEQRALEKGIALRTKLDAGLPQHVFGDALRIRQILIHLIGNAVKFTQRGRIDVRARAQAIDGEDDGLMLEFSVKDTGIGLDPRRAASLFEAFGQAEDGTARRFGGTGLGLSIAQQLVRLMGGEIQVDSEPGRGSTFTVQLRVARGDATKVAPAPSADDNPEALRGLRVLLVEDNAVNQEVASRILGRIGVRTTVASNGQRAIELAKAERFDAVLMDVHMPGLDGYQTTQRIRALPDRQELPIIALTAHAVAGYRERCLASGMNDYLTKPVEPETLYRTLLRWTRGAVVAQSENDVEVEADATTVATAPASSSVAAAEPARLVLPGFDTVGALRRVGGEQAFYRRLLLAFVDDFADMNPQLRRLLEAGEMEQAKRLLHSFKGVAATVGADELAEMALNMERSLASESKVESAALGEFETAFRWACASIREIADEPVNAASAGSDAAALDQELAELAVRLDRSDPTCDALWETLRPQLGDGFDPKLVQRLDNELHAFAFRAAADTVAQLREQQAG